MVYPEKMKANPEEIQSVAVYEEVPKEEAIVKTVKSVEEVVRGPASRYKAPPTAE
jgi:hypothetical protein